MIDENKTFILFKYKSENLSRGSHKKVWCICNECGKERLLEYRKYRDLCFKCKHGTKETRQKISKNHADVSGKNNPRWKGGKKSAKARTSAKRRKLLGFTPHNNPQENFHGHHLDFNHVIFIPKELHISISHSVINNKNMSLINDVACNWYLKYQII